MDRHTARLFAGIGATDATSPSWDLFLGAILTDGHVIVKTGAGSMQNVPPDLLKNTRQEDRELERACTRESNPRPSLPSSVVCM